MWRDEILRVQNYNKKNDICKKKGKIGANIDKNAQRFAYMQNFYYFCSAKYVEPWKSLLKSLFFFLLFPYVW